MRKTSSAAAAAIITLLLNIFTSSHGQEMPAAARETNSQRRSLRSGMTAEDDFLKGGREAQSEKFQTKISSTTTKDVPMQNSFYNLDAFTPKEVSVND